jgi:nonsense-mediated mRNA decay protein 3
MARGPGAEFCVLCGRTGDEITEGLCPSCRIARLEAIRLPSVLELTICPHCGARRIGRHWESRDEPDRLHRADIDPWLVVVPPAELEDLRWTERGENPLLRVLVGEATVRFGSSHRVVPIRTEVRIQSRTCPVCSRRGGNFYTAHIQLRASQAALGRPLREFKTWVHTLWEDLVRESPPELTTTITREEELREGWDIYFLETPAARALARAFKARTGSEFLETASLYGVREGRQIYRTTFLVRLPPLAPGDLVEIREGLWELLRWRPSGRPVFREVQTGSVRDWPEADLRAGRFVGGIEKIREASVEKTAEGWVAHVSEGGISVPWPLSGRTPREAPVGPVRLVLDQRRAWWAPWYSGGRRRRSSRQSKRHI